MDAAFQKLFAACKSDSNCNQHYPNLEMVFYQLVEELNQVPVRIPVSNPETEEKFPAAVVDGDTLLEMTFQMMYAGSLIPTLPRMIYDLKDGDYDFFSKIFELLVFDRSISLGMYYSVICSEDADFSPNDVHLEGVHPEISRIEKDTPEDLLEICGIWKVDQLAPEVDQPVSSSVPTLLLSGYFDPITPPDYAAEAAKNPQPQPACHIPNRLPWAGTRRQLS